MFLLNLNADLHTLNQVNEMENNLDWVWVILGIAVFLIGFPLTFIFGKPGSEYLLFDVICSVIGAFLFGIGVHDVRVGLDA